ncbi:hypothetical protein ASG84_22245 [Rhodococcus sp. Leaf278]|uniref:hypothetical protein n=1 Tax=Nocardiaceae TaxID=85025 RepID=UPI00070ECB20|nr:MULTISPECIES: hypothetical protein [Rhodococcus]KQU55518.1 hypothetical protein ASG84_22245 [Rhodococcus sp. Leaf278]CAH0132933.1 hypothetical protein SRABI91_00273 [Rhodococcus fascians]
MSSKNLFGGPRTLLIVAAVVIAIALVAAAATLIVRAVLGPPEGENKFEIKGYSVVQVDPQVSDLALATR